MMKKNNSELISGKKKALRGRCFFEVTRKLRRKRHPVTQGQTYFLVFAPLSEFFKENFCESSART